MMLPPPAELQPTLYEATEMESGSHHWIRTRDGDDSVRSLFDRHYSRRPAMRGTLRSKLFMGPGEKLVLRTADSLAILAFRKFISEDRQSGVNLSIFRNEGEVLSSTLLLDGMGVAWQHWPRERLYTYINPRRILSPNPGYCFLVAGWQRCGYTTKGLHVLEVFPDAGDRASADVSR